MSCQCYLDEFLAAHVDGELIGRELRDADRHLDDCTRCRESFVDERRLKALIRTHTATVKAPADLRMRIRAALGEAVGRDEMAQHQLSSRDGSRLSIGHRVWRQGGRIAGLMRNPSARTAVPVAAVASIVLTTVFLTARYRQSRLPDVPPTQVFDLAVNKFDAFGRGFSPNAPVEAESRRDDSNFAWIMDRDSGSSVADESADLARAYREANLPEEVYDFSPAGYGLDGGRIDQTARDGTVTYTLYRGQKGEILSVFLHAPDFSAPIGARYWVGPHTFYEYRDHSICLTFHPAGHFISILVANEPVLNLVQDVALVDGTAASS